VSFTLGDLVSFDGRDATRTLVWLRGEHDASTQAALSEILTLAIALDAADLVVDLSQVEFMGAATVGVMARTRELLRSRSRTLELRAPSLCARRVLHVCGLDLLDQSPAS
jgi:anti-anti-sigma factor